MVDDSSSVVTVATWDATEGVDAVEPVPSCGTGLVAVATYALGEDGMRSGSVAILRAGRDSNGHAITHVTSTPRIAGVLDIRCVPARRGALLLAACADACVRAFRVPPEPDTRNGELALAWLWAVGHGPEPSGPIILSLDVETWPCVDGKDVQEWRTAVASDSFGGVHLLSFSDNACEERWAVEAAHSDSAWTCTLGRVDGMRGGTGEHVVYTGGDDGVLAAWDMRASQTKPVDENSRAHGGVGVTSLLFLGDAGVSSGGLLSGGYDDHLRLWDRRSLRRCISSVNCGGGVWRIKREPTRHIGSCGHGQAGRELVLLGCMYDGFKVVSVGADDSLAVVARYDAHESLAYGAAWLPGEVTETGGLEAGGSIYQRFAVTGSFYDHAVRYWQMSTRFNLAS